MNDRSAHTHPWKISDLVMFPALAIAILAEYLIPNRIVPLTFWLLIPVGLAVVIAGLKLISASKTALEAQDQPSLPGEPTTQLVTDGPYRFSRNPNYLGAILMAFGMAIAANSLWFLLVASCAMLVLDRWMIRPEERYLHETFGQEYRDYTQRTRRWL
ncbi:isoprenylcysteine carboxylmethyltransferase family protein [Aliiroseovarius sp. S2029]|nr:isoprenylcysteine carboxylmethyltransferase family protein [Aliiroseovarius sp. S2029]